MLTPDNLKALLCLSPAPSIKLYPDFPCFTIASVNEYFLLTVGLITDMLIGKGPLSLFTKRVAGTGERIREMSAALESVYSGKTSQQMLPMDTPGMNFCRGTFQIFVYRRGWSY